MKIYVSTSEIPRDALNILTSVGEVRVNPSPGPPARETLISEVQDADALFCLLTEKVDVELIAKARQLRIVANMAVGYDNISIPEATQRGIMVSNTPGVLTETTADTTMGLILSVARRLPEADRYVREGKWKIPWSPMMMTGTDVHGKTIAIYGVGRIGAAVAKRARGFGMRILYTSSHRKPELEESLGMEYVSLEDALKQCDFLSIHVPLRPETRHSIGRPELSLMKKTAFLINTARGAVVDEDALAEALESHAIAGAGLDVFEREPLPGQSPLLKMDNVVLLPHIGSASVETRTAMAKIAAKNIAAALKGEVPPNLVNPEVLVRK